MTFDIEIWKPHFRINMHSGTICTATSLNYNLNLSSHKLQTIINFLNLWNLEYRKYMEKALHSLKLQNKFGNQKKYYQSPASTKSVSCAMSLRFRKVHRISCEDSWDLSGFPPHKFCHELLLRKATCSLIGVLLSDLRHSKYTQWFTCFILSCFEIVFLKGHATRPDIFSHWVLAQFLFLQMIWYLNARCHICFQFSLSSSYFHNPISWSHYFHHSVTGLQSLHAPLVFVSVLPFSGTASRSLRRAPKILKQVPIKKVNA